MTGGCRYRKGVSMIFLKLGESYLIVGFMSSARELTLRVRLGSSPHVASPGSLGHVSPA